MKLIYAFGICAAFGLVLYGWGWAIRRVVRVKPANWPATVASGMAAVVFIGGVLNLARLAYPWALAGVTVAGAALGITAVARSFREKWELSALFRAFPLVTLVPAVAVLAFVVVTQLPPRAYNFHDDYEKYFGHTVRMLETGTVFGSPLSVIGLDTLGGQAFLQAFPVAFFSLRYINSVDAAFAMFLCMMLASQFTKGRQELLPMTLVCTLSVVIIDPQYVNVSALYTGSLLMMALIEEEGSGAAVTGLLYGALAALKSSFALFILAHLVATLWVRGVKWTSRTVAAGALFLAPWILVHAPHYVAVLGGGLAIADKGVRPVESFNIFSTDALSYGSTAANYTWLVIAIGLSGLMVARARGKVEMTAAACFATIAAYLAALYVSGPRVAGYEQAIRYFTPFVIAVAPAAFGSAALAFSETATLRSRWLRWGAPLFVAAVPVLAFGPSLLNRAGQAVTSGSVLAFTWHAPKAEYLQYNQRVLNGDIRQRVAAAQAKVPAGEEVMVWMNAAFYLDYARDRIENVEPAEGFVTPWAKMPDARFFIWEYTGYAKADEAHDAERMAEGPDLMRRALAARLNMTRWMNDQMQHSEKLYDDGAIAAFRR